MRFQLGALRASTALRASERASAPGAPKQKHGTDVACGKEPLIGLGRAISGRTRCMAQPRTPAMNTDQAQMGKCLLL